MNQEEFLIQHLTEEKSYTEISEESGIKREQLSDWWETGTELRELIKKSNQIFSNKKPSQDFDYFKNIGKRGFFEWYRKQPRICGYCGIEEHKLQKIFDFKSGILGTKRGRGRILELERKDTESNEYNETNCILACYVCNNHKSDMISEEDHRTYFAGNIREYLERKYEELIQNDNR